MSAVSKIVAERNQKILLELVVQPGNDCCADCKAPSPRWASYNLGIFLCVNCAAIHRKIGTHITKVKSLTMDSWTKEQTEGMRQNGNRLSNAKYNPNELRHPPPTNLMSVERDSELEQFIRFKYEYKRFMGTKPPAAAAPPSARPSSSEPSQAEPVSSEIAQRTLLPRHDSRGLSLRLPAATAPKPESSNVPMSESPKVADLVMLSSHDSSSVSHPLQFSALQMHNNPQQHYVSMPSQPSYLTAPTLMTNEVPVYPNIPNSMPNHQFTAPVFPSLSPIPPHPSVQQLNVQQLHPIAAQTVQAANYVQQFPGMHSHNHHQGLSVTSSSYQQPPMYASQYMLSSSPMPYLNTQGMPTAISSQQTPFGHGWTSAGYSSESKNQQHPWGTF